MLAALPATSTAAGLRVLLPHIAQLVLPQLGCFQSIPFRLALTLSEILHSKKVNFEQSRRSKAAFNNLHLE